MASEIELYSKLNDPLDAINRIGNFFAKSGMFGCDRPEQGQVLAMICLAEKKSPVAITRDYDIVEGKLRKKALAALAEFRQMGGKHKWLRSGDEQADTDEARFAEIELIDREGAKIGYRYSMADARQEGLIRDKSRWTKRPGNMLRARCISNGLGMLCPEIFAGDDGSDEAPAMAEIDLGKSQQQPTVIDIEAAKAEPKKEEPAEQPSAATSTDAAQTAAAQPEAKEFKQGPAYPATGQQLPDELVQQVQNAIGEHAVNAGKWMLKEGWLQPGQGIEHLSEARARRILKQRDSFIKAVTAA